MDYKEQLKKMDQIFRKRFSSEMHWKTDYLDHNFDIRLWFLRFFYLVNLYPSFTDRRDFDEDDERMDYPSIPVMFERIDSKRKTKLMYLIVKHIGFYTKEMMVDSIREIVPDFKEILRTEVEKGIKIWPTFNAFMQPTLTTETYGEVFDYSLGEWFKLTKDYSVHGLNYIEYSDVGEIKGLDIESIEEWTKKLYQVFYKRVIKEIKDGL